MDSKDKSMAWRDVVLNKLDCYCTRFNRGASRGAARFRELQPYLLVGFLLLYVWIAAITPGMHSWVAQQRALAAFLNSHDSWAYVYVVIQFFVMPFFFSAWLTYGVFRLVRAIQSRKGR